MYALDQIAKWIHSRKYYYISISVGLHNDRTVGPRVTDEDRERMYVDQFYDIAAPAYVDSTGKQPRGDAIEVCHETDVVFAGPMLIASRAA